MEFNLKMIGLTESTIVYTKTGLTEIKNLSTSDKLLTKDGTFHHISRIIEKHTNKKIVKLSTKTSMNPVICSTKHRLYSIKLPILYKIFPKLSNTRYHKPHYYVVDELKKGDLIGYPIPTYIKDCNISDLDFYKFYGLMLLFGNNPTIYQYTIELKSNNPDIKFIEHYLSSHDLHYGKYIYKNQTTISWHDILDQKLCLHRELLYEHNNLQKSVHSSFLFLPRPKSYEIIRPIIEQGFFKSDSSVLSYTLKFMLLRMGFLVTTKNNTLFTIIKPSLVYHNFLWTPITYSKQTTFTGLIYDIHLKDDFKHMHNFTTDIGLLHTSH